MSAAGEQAGALSRDSVGAAPRQVRFDDRGVVIVEYVVVLLLVSGVACGAIVILGMAIAKFYMSQEAWIGLPIP